MFELLAQHHDAFHWVREIPPHVHVGTGLVVFLLWAIGVYLVAAKTKTEGAWLAFIPIVQFVVPFWIARMSALWILGLFVPILNIVVFAMVWMGMFKTCKKEPLAGLLAFIFPIQPILLLYLVLSD